MPYLAKRSLKGQIFILQSILIISLDLARAGVGFTILGTRLTIIAVYLSSNSPTSNSCSTSALTDGGQACLAHAHGTCAICYIHQSTTKIDNDVVYKSSIVGCDTRSILWIK